jgi:hypothetical protein
MTLHSETSRRTGIVVIVICRSLITKDHVIAAVNNDLN